MEARYYIISLLVVVVDSSFMKPFLCGVPPDDVALPSRK